MSIVDKHNNNLPGYWLIYFCDADRKPEIITDRDAAIARYEQLSDNWNCHLFERIAVNFKEG